MKVGALEWPGTHPPTWATHAGTLRKAVGLVVLASSLSRIARIRAAYQAGEASSFSVRPDGEDSCQF